MTGRYRFVGRRGDRYIWHRPIPEHSRVEEISCDVDWFWQREPEPKTVNTTAGSVMVVLTSGEVTEYEGIVGAPSVPLPGFGKQTLDLFEVWSGLNCVVGDWRSRFDVLREELPKCRTRAEAMALIEAEGFGGRYGDLPEWLP